MKTDHVAESLDWELIQDSEGEYHVWTPDDTGAVIGTGSTQTEALYDAIESLSLTMASLRAAVEPCENDPTL